MATTCTSQPHDGSLLMSAHNAWLAGDAASAGDMSLLG